MAIKARYTYISGTMIDRMTVLTANYAFSTTPCAKKLTRAIATTTDNRKVQCGRFARHRNFWQSVVVAIIWLIFCQPRHHRKSRTWSGYYLSQLQRCNYFRFWRPHRHFRLSVSVVYLLANIVSHLYMVLYPQRCWHFNCTFRSLRDISISGFGHHFRLSLIIGIA